MPHDWTGIPDPAAAHAYLDNIKLDYINEERLEAIGVETLIVAALDEIGRLRNRAAAAADEIERLAEVVRSWAESAEAAATEPTNRHRTRLEGPLTYPFRRAWWWAKTPERSCLHRWCAHPTTGLSIWCRSHTDTHLKNTPR